MAVGPLEQKNHMQLSSFLKSWLKGYGQIMLQSNGITGFLFLIGTAFYSLTMLFGMIFWGGVATFIGKMLRRSESVALGLYGFNGTLVGLAGLSFMQLSVKSLSLTTMCVVLATWLTHLLQASRVPCFTLPFVISTWFLILIFPSLGITPTESLHTVIAPSHFSGVISGIGQILLQDQIVSCLFFIFGLLVNNIRYACWALLGSFVGYIAGYVPGFSEGLASQGIYGFNPALTAIALSASTVIIGWGLPVLGILLAILITQLFVLYEIPVLTAPFVLATWCILLLQHSLSGWFLDEEK